MYWIQLVVLLVVLSTCDYTCRTKCHETLSGDIVCTTVCR